MCWSQIRGEKQVLINKTNIIFSGCIAKTPSSPFESPVVVKNFNFLMSIEDIKKGFIGTYQKICSVYRFHSNSSKKLLPIISIRTKNYYKRFCTYLIEEVFVKHTNNPLFVASTVKGLVTGPITVY